MPVSPIPAFNDMLEPASQAAIREGGFRLLFWENAFPNPASLATSAAGLGTVCMAKPLRGKELPGASWLWKITWSPANSLLPWQPRKMGNLSLIHPLCLASWQGYAHSAASGLL